MIRLRGNLSITQPQGAEHEYVSIKLGDENAGVKAVSIIVSLEDFARALAGRMVKCEFEFNDSRKVGKNRETKTELVDRPSSFTTTLDELRHHLEPFEVNGWQGSLADLINDRRAQGDKQLVTFERWI